MSESFVPSEFGPEGETPSKTSIVEKELKNSQTLEVEIRKDSVLPSIVSQPKSKDSAAGFFNFLPKLSAFFSRNEKIAAKVSTLDSPPLPRVAELLIEKAQGRDLTKVSPLGALQLAIERINWEAKEAASFKGSLARGLFSKAGKATKEEVDALWGKSTERKMICEIYVLIDMSIEVRRPITFRDAFLRVYDTKSDSDKAALDKISKLLLLGRC